jgi:hypothetical protein
MARLIQPFAQTQQAGLSRLPIIDLCQCNRFGFVERIVTGHNEMPEFVFEADQAAANIAYLDSLKAK